MISKTVGNGLPRSNGMIRVPSVRVIRSNGQQLGVYQTWEAIRLAKDEGLDLVEVNAKSNPPVCKIMDFGKFKYEQKKRDKEIARNQKVVETKQVNVRPTTDEHDLQTKANQIRRFISEGNKVRIVVMFKGREVAHAKMGEEAVQKMLDCLDNSSFKVEEQLNLNGKQMTALISPSTL